MRFSLGPFTTDDEIDATIAAVGEIAAIRRCELRRASRRHLDSRKLTESQAHGRKTLVHKRACDSSARSAAIAAPVRRATSGSIAKKSQLWPNKLGLAVDEFEQKYVRQRRHSQEPDRVRQRRLRLLRRHRRASARSTTPGRGNAAPGPSGNRTSRRRKPGSEPAKSAPAAARESCISVEQILHQISIVKL